jgi:iron(III) transport system permease protein
VTFLRFISIVIAVLVALPLVVVLSSLLHPETDIWLHLWQYVLPGVLYNTLFLLLGVLAGVLFLGVSLAWRCLPM